MSFLGVIYGLHVKEDAQHIASFFYVGGSLGVVFAGDYLTVFIFWEMMAFASTFLIWFRREPASLKAGFRYLLMHIFGGLLLLAGIFLHYKNTGSMAFELIPKAGAGFAEYLILAGFALNAAVFPLHAWLPGCLSGSHGHRCGLHVRLYDQDGGLCPGPGLSRF